MKLSVTFVILVIVGPTATGARRAAPIERAGHHRHAPAPGARW